ncbi:GntR family transcriptional regulator [Thermanaeromonas sp. C210]|uniref:GntR family transcriptional regulator n=1 Tax=Thermanaeromonas sp. C210 TaxID=2731925 RepID=UPI00155B7B71|nr:GntR family transcriptional regulator [Thermanaeromonas sp. C210]GFN21747.1 GntR family transcriptional regulator [Thermanaeromonas sp. C210]
MKNLLAGKLENYKPLREIVFETLREAILSGQLKAGERLMEVQLAEEMGVSRTPVREAIRKLELEGLVVMVPRKGAYVAGISTKDITEVFEIRSALESLAAALACERITEEELEELERLLVQVAECAEKNDLETLIQVDTRFHNVLYRASRNERLAQIINNLGDQIQRFRTTSLATPGRMKEALEEHKALVEAITARDVELAQRLAQEHIENAENRLMEAMRKGMNSSREEEAS